VAAGDLNGDGYADIVVGADRGGGPQVEVIDGRTGNVLSSFYAFPAFFTGGVRVASGDVNGDGIPDIICAAGPGGGPLVAVYNGSNPANLLETTYALSAPAFSGGIFVAAGDVNGDGRADVICSADTGGGPQVAVYDGRDLSQALLNYYAYPATFTGGVRIAARDVNGDGRADIVTTPGTGGGPQVTIFDSQTLAFLASFYATTPRYSGGLYAG
jgi:hypothetical protein